MVAIDNFYSSETPKPSKVKLALMHPLRHLLLVIMGRQLVGYSRPEYTKKKIKVNK